VLTPERLPILESRKALETLSQFDVPVGALIVNRVLPADAEGGFLKIRQEQEAAYLQEIDETFARLPRYRLALLERDVHGVDALERIARRLVG
jgi:arsenite/tail-anchored protein-transporting ATPase